MAALLTSWTFWVPPAVTSPHRAAPNVVTTAVIFLGVSPQPITISCLADEGLLLPAGCVIPVLVVVWWPDCKTVLTGHAVRFTLLPVLPTPTRPHVLPSPSLPSKVPPVISSNSYNAIRKVEVVSHPVPDIAIWDCRKHTSKVSTVLFGLVSKQDGVLLDPIGYMTKIGLLYFAETVYFMGLGLLNQFFSEHLVHPIFRLYLVLGKLTYL